MEVLEEKAMTSREIKLKLLEKKGRCNSTNLSRGLAHLVRINKLNRKVFSKKGEKGLIYLYSLN